VYDVAPTDPVHVSWIVVVVVVPCASPVGAAGSVKTFVTAVEYALVPPESTAATSKQYDVPALSPVYGDPDASVSGDPYAPQLPAL
jgi:hypothetical protein